MVSIPQAVGTVATETDALVVEVPCFNTASGRHCCNVVGKYVGENTAKLVSIPQAVGTVATAQGKDAWYWMRLASFNTASGRHCCNNQRKISY